MFSTNETKILISKEQCKERWVLKIVDSNDWQWCCGTQICVINWNIQLYGFQNRVSSNCATFLYFRYFPNFSKLSKCFLWNVTLIFSRYRCNLAAVTSVKYGFELKILTCAFAHRSKIFLTEKSMNGALVTPTIDTWWRQITFCSLDRGKYMQTFEWSALSKTLQRFILTVAMATTIGCIKTCAICCNWHCLISIISI